MVGQLLDWLEELKLDDETYVILMSDHGENSMEHRQLPTDHDEHLHRLE